MTNMILTEIILLFLHMIYTVRFAVYYTISIVIRVTHLELNNVS